jgi:hypothetical protein
VVFFFGENYLIPSCKFADLVSTKMAKRVVRGGDDEEGLQKLVDSVFNSDNKVSDLSFSGTSDSDSNSSSERSEENDSNECAPGPSKSVRTTTQKNISDWNWTPTDNNPIIFPFNTYSGVCADLLKKYESQPPSELQIFLEYMDPLFVKICEETNAYATKQCRQKEAEKR